MRIVESTPEVLIVEKDLPPAYYGGTIGLVVGIALCLVGSALLFPISNLVEVSCGMLLLALGFYGVVEGSKSFGKPRLVKVWRFSASARDILEVLKGKEMERDLKVEKQWHVTADTTFAAHTEAIRAYRGTNYYHQLLARRPNGEESVILHAPNTVTLTQLVSKANALFEIPENDPTASAPLGAGLEGEPQSKFGS